MRDELYSHNYQYDSDGYLRKLIGNLAQDLGARIAEQSDKNADYYLIPDKIGSGYYRNNAADL